MISHDACHIGNTRLVTVRNPELARAQRRMAARRRPSLVSRIAGWLHA